MLCNNIRSHAIFMIPSDIGTIFLPSSQMKKVRLRLSAQVQTTSKWLSEDQREPSLGSQRCHIPPSLEPLAVGGLISMKQPQGFRKITRRASTTTWRPINQMLSSSHWPAWLSLTQRRGGPPACRREDSEGLSEYIIFKV